MSLVRVVWGGHIYTSPTAGTPVDEWSCSVSLIGPLDPDVDGILTGVSNTVITFHTSAAAKIHPTVALEFCKVNEFDPVTGLQMTDPTVQIDWLSTTHRGAGTVGNRVPITTAYRVSAGANTRAATARGGFYVPRPALLPRDDGRYEQADINDMLSAAEGLMGGFTSASYQPGIWSRKLGSVTAIEYLRIGDVPDNNKTRKNAIEENYTRADAPFS